MVFSLRWVTLTLALLSLSRASHEGASFYVGGPGRALSFDGNDFTVLGDGGIPCPPFTIEFWLERNSYRSGVVLSHFSRWDSRTLFAITDLGDSPVREFSPSPRPTDPYHWALTADNNSTWSVYLNATFRRHIQAPAESIAKCASATPAAYPWVLGCLVHSRGSLLVAKDGFCFDGRMDELRLWARALSSTELRKRMRVPPGEDWWSPGLGGSGGLIRRWSFDSSSSSRRRLAAEAMHGDDGGNPDSSPSVVTSRFPLVGGYTYLHISPGSIASVTLCAAALQESNTAEVRVSMYVREIQRKGYLINADGEEVRLVFLDLVAQPADEGSNLTVLCGSVKVTSSTTFSWYAYVGANFELWSQNRLLTRLYRYSYLRISYTTIASSSGGVGAGAAHFVVGRARAVKIVGTQMRLGVFDLPTPTKGETFALSFWFRNPLVPYSRVFSLVRGPLRLAMTQYSFYVNRVRWYIRNLWPSQYGSPTSWVMTLSDLVVVNVNCTGSESIVEPFLKGQSLGSLNMSGCWNASIPWDLGDPTSCNPKGEVFDDFRLWKRMLTLEEMQQLRQGHEVGDKDEAACISFDHVVPNQVCRDLKSLGVDTWCTDRPFWQPRSLYTIPHLALRCGTTMHSSSPFFFRGVITMPSPFQKLPGSAIHKILREGTHVTQTLREDKRPDLHLTYSLQSNSSVPGVELIEDLLSYSAPDLTGQTGSTVNVSFWGCNQNGKCLPGLVVFHVLPRGPTITRFQLVPTFSLMRLFFSEPTNMPDMSTGCICDLFEFSGFPSDVPSPTVAEWANNQSLRFLFPPASMWRLLRMSGNSTSESPLTAMTVRIKPDTPGRQLRDALGQKYPSDDIAVSPEVLLCREGTSPQYGAPGCEGCQAGHAWTLREGCLPCEPGRFQPATGQVDCIRCPVGRYVRDMGTTGCESCETSLPGSTTLYQGMRSNDSCICPAGWTWARDTPLSRPKCQACTEGLLCPGGRRQVNGTESAAGSHHVALQAAGFSAGKPAWAGGQPVFLVRCSSRARCPGGLEMGTCPPLALGIACAECAIGAFLDRDQCRPCEGADDTLPLMSPFVLLFFALLCIYWFSTRPPALFSEQTATLTTSCSVLFAGMQVLGALAISDVPWPEPMPTLKSWLDVVMLQVDFQGFRCFVAVGDSAASYLGSVVLYPVLSTSLTVVLFLKRGIMRQKLDVAQVINMQGLALMSLFTSIAVLSVTPLKCRTDNPDGSSTLEAYRSVVCWQSDQHRAMLGGSIAACLVFVVGFIAIVTWATAVYPSQVVAPDGGVHLARFRFLFWPYTPKRYYFGMLFGLRKLMVALAPLLFVSWGQGQLLLMMFVICGNMFLQCSLWPWRTFKTNTLDALIAVILMTLMATGFMLGNFEGVSEGDSERTAQRLVVVSLSLGLGVLLWTLVWYVLKVLLMPRRTYKIFLSHHKVGAGLLARWVKMLLQECGVDAARVFLDSDNLLHLDRLMHTVAHDTENVVVLLTGETLGRPWCAMEIVAAYRAGTQVIPVYCDGYTEIDDSFLDSLSFLWTLEQQTTMASGGVEVADVREAYLLLRAEMPLRLARQGADVQTHQQLVKDALARCTGRASSRRLATRVRGPSHARSKLLPIQQLQSLDNAKVVARVAILSDLAVDEPACACRVLQNLLQENLQESVVVSTELREEFRHVLVLLGPGILKNMSIARLLVQAAEQPGVQDLVPLLVGDFFEFPGPSFWSDLREGRVFTHEELERESLTPERVEAAYRRLLNILAMRFSGHASSDIQSAEIAFMVSRIHGCLKSSTSKTQDLAPTSSSRSIGREATATVPAPSLLEQRVVLACI